MRLRLLAPVLASFCFALPAAGQAQEYSEVLSTCIVKNTSPADRQALIKWIFAAMAKHPDLAAYSNLKPSDTAQITKTSSQLFERLMTVDCRSETMEVLRNEGLKGMEKGFAFLGQTAMYELMAHPKVSDELSELDKGFDKSKFETLERRPRNPGRQPSNKSHSKRLDQTLGATLPIAL